MCHFKCGTDYAKDSVASPSEIAVIEYTAKVHGEHYFKPFYAIFIFHQSLGGVYFTVSPPTVHSQSIWHHCRGEAYHNCSA